MQIQFQPHEFMYIQGTQRAQKKQKKKISIITGLMLGLFFILILFQIYGLNTQNTTTLTSSFINTLHKQYYCEEVFVIPQLSKQLQKNLNLDAKFIKYNDLLSQIPHRHEILINQSTFPQMYHKCAVINGKYMRVQFLKLLKFDHLFIEMEFQNNLLYTKLQNFINEHLANDHSTYALNAEIKTAQIQNKKYITVIFSKPLEVTEKGYWSGNSKKDADGHHTHNLNLDARLIEFYKKQNISSIVDFGCGLCNYVVSLKKAGFNATGFDGNPFTFQLTKGVAKSLDLAQPQDLGTQYDWVQSIQVGEHIPPAKTDIFVDNLVKHAKKGVFLTWGVVGQGGFGHINQKNNDQVIQIMAKKGFQFDEKVANWFRQITQGNYFARSLMVFRKK